MIDLKRIEQDAPGYPDCTCPIVDSGIREASDIQSEAENLHNTVESAVESINGTFEELREANSDLRESGAYWHKQCRLVYEELEEAREVIEVLEQSIAELKEQLQPSLPLYQTTSNGHSVEAPQ